MLFKSKISALKFRFYVNALLKWYSSAIFVTQYV